LREYAQSGSRLSFTSMIELSPLQMQTMERLFAAGFRPIAIPPYESALCLRKGECVVILAPVPNGGLKMLAPPSYLVDGKPSVRIKRGTREWFVWKEKEVEATPERLLELETFRSELTELLELPRKQ
jgi:hypothetical protein